MPRELRWNGQRGTAVVNTRRVTLPWAPSLGFAFDTLTFADGQGERTTDGQTQPLDSDQVAAVNALLDTYAEISDDRRVWGVDVQGQPLGLVPPEQAHAVVGPPPAGEGWRWDFEGSGWVRVLDLDELRATVWERIKRARDAHEHGGFDTTHGRFDSDPTSQSKIIGAVSVAQMALASSQTFAIEWTLQDNSTVVLDAQNVIDVGLALMAHVDLTHQTGRTLRAQIFDPQASREAIEAVNWPNS